MEDDEVFEKIQMQIINDWMGISGVREMREKSKLRTSDGVGPVELLEDVYTLIYV